jgi:nucleotide-binding universal stress UspA family protein
MNLKGPVLVGIDLTAASAEALRQAHRLAVDLSSRLIVCHVLPEFPSVRMLFPQLAGTDAGAAEALTRKARAAVEHEVATIVGLQPSEWQLVIDTGTPHSGLLIQAAAVDAGVIVTGPGHVADQVMRHASVPVLVARPSPTGDVIGATDLSDSSLPALDTAAAEARRRKARLRLVHVVDIGRYAFAGAVAGSFTYLGGTPALEAIDQLRADAQARLQQKLAATGVEGEAVAVAGAAATMILDLAESSRAQLVVVGTHGRSGLSRLTMGSTAAAIVRSAPCSVLVVRLAPPIHELSEGALSA